MGRWRRRERGLIGWNPRPDDLDDTLERLRTRGAQLVGEVIQYKNTYRLCYIRGPEGLLIGLAQELS